MRRTTKASIAAITGTAMAVAVLPGIAHAAVLRCSYQGDDYACSTNYSLSADYKVCDMEEDGHGVYAYFYGAAGSITRVGDPNGSASGCGTRTGYEPVVTIEVCETITGPDICTISRW